MSRRIWTWGAGLTLVGGAMLASDIHAVATWQPSTDSPSVLTLDQLVGFIVSVSLLIAAGLVFTTGIRRRQRATAAFPVEPADLRPERQPTPPGCEPITDR